MLTDRPFDQSFCNSKHDMLQCHRQIGTPTATQPGQAAVCTNSDRMSHTSIMARRTKKARCFGT